MAVTNKSAKKGANKKGDKLNVLLSAAMALPGMAAHAQEAGVRADSVKLDYNHAEYKESDDRMDISLDQLSITVPIASRFEFNANIVKDVISGASPVLYLADSVGEEPVMVKQAGASIKDERDVLELAAGFYGSKDYVSAKIGRSEEDDYEATYGGFDGVHYFNNKSTNLLYGFSQSNDEVWNVYFPNETSSDFDPFLDETVVKDRKQVDQMIGVDQVLGKKSHIQLSLTSVKATGDLSDPYKKVYILDEDILGILGIYNVQGGGTPEGLEEYILSDEFDELPFGLELGEGLRNAMGVYGDSRPDSRQQTILLVRYSQYFEFADAGLHIDYRYADDGWGSTSATIEFAWSQALPGGVIITPGIRYYSQDSADFYKPVFETKPGRRDQRTQKNRRILRRQIRSQ